MTEEELRAKIEEIESRVSALEKRFQENTPGVKGKKISVREFLDTLGSASQTDYVVYIGYFKENYESLESFTGKELLEGFRDAKEKKPANINALINDNISKGLLMSSEVKEGNLKRFELTNKGVKFVEAKLSK